MPHHVEKLKPEDEVAGGEGRAVQPAEQQAQLGLSQSHAAVARVVSSAATRALLTVGRRAPRGRPHVREQRVAPRGGSGELERACHRIRTRALPARATRRRTVANARHRAHAAASLAEA